MCAKSPSANKNPPFDAPPMLQKQRKKFMNENGNLCE